MRDTRVVVRALLGKELERVVTDEDMEKTFDDLGLDSLNLMNAIVELEDQLQIKISNKDVARLYKGTPNQLVDFVKYTYGRDTTNQLTPEKVLRDSRTAEAAGKD